MAALAKEEKYFAMRHMMRAGKVTDAALSASCDGKTAVEWVWDAMTKWNFAADMNDDSLLAFKLMSELKYRYVSNLNPVDRYFPANSKTLRLMLPLLCFVCSEDGCELSSSSGWRQRVPCRRWRRWQLC